jgi:TctA family transporter
MIMLAGIYYGAQYGGSTTAILINLPGENSSAVTAIDGYRMARQGRAGAALSAAALGSFFAGTVSTLLIALFGPPLTSLAQSFGPAEYFSLIVLGLVSSVALAHGSIVKAIAMIVLGLLLGLVGTDIYTGTQRFTFGEPSLSEGVNFVAIAVGMFGLAEILRNLETANTREVGVQSVSGLWLSRNDLARISGPVLRGSAIGSILGVLPGGGATLSSFVAYALEKRVSKEPQSFGKGAIEGVAAPESANNAGAQTSFIPMLTLGIPAHPVMALMMAALIIQGITPGPTVATAQPKLFWGLIVSMWVGNVMLVILNLPLIGIWVRLLRIPYDLLVLIIVAFSCIGVFSVDANVYDLYSAALFGFVGYVLVKLDCEPAPLLLGFVLGPLLEQHLRRAMIISRGDPLVFIDIQNRPISACLIAVSAIVLVVVLSPSISRKRENVFAE